MGVQSIHLADMVDGDLDIKKNVQIAFSLVLVGFFR